MAPKTASGSKCTVQPSEDTAADSCLVCQETSETRTGRSSIVCTSFTHKAPPADLCNIDIGSATKEQSVFQTSDYVSQEAHARPTTSTNQVVESQTHPTTHDVAAIHSNSVTLDPSQDQLAVFIQGFSLISAYLGSPTAAPDEVSSCPHLVMITPTILAPVEPPRVTMPPLYKAFVALCGPDPGGGGGGGSGGSGGGNTTHTSYEEELRKYCSLDAIVGEVVPQESQS